MFHYDPRRWLMIPVDILIIKIGLRAPGMSFKYIATKKKEGLFIGFKMYPPLGYKPLDPRLPLLERFYKRCEEEEIPILCHCSPGGMTTHEADFYYELDKADLKKQPNHAISCTYDHCTPLGYFFDNYVHPKNWRPVLKKYPKLKLALPILEGENGIPRNRQKGILVRALHQTG